MLEIEGVTYSGKTAYKHYLEKTMSGARFVLKQLEKLEKIEKDPAALEEIKRSKAFQLALIEYGQNNLLWLNDPETFGYYPRPCRRDFEEI